MPCLSSFGLENQVVVVTGAGRGIGRVVAKDALRSGAKLAIGSRTMSELKTLSDEIREAGGECFYHSLDVTKVESMSAFMAAVIAHYGRIDVLVNNAGYNKLGKLIDCTEEQ